MNLNTIMVTIAATITGISGIGVLWFGHVINREIRAQRQLRAGRYRMSALCECADVGYMNGYDHSGQAMNRLMARASKQRRAQRNHR
jgi:hypothetical protein